MGEGRRAGLYQMNSWHKCSSPASRNFNSALRTVVDITGSPRCHALPISITIEASGVSKLLSKGAKLASHLTYAAPVKFPYCFFVLRGNGGEVNISCTLPAYFLNDSLHSS